MEFFVRRFDLPKWKANLFAQDMYRMGYLEPGTLRSFDKCDEAFSEFFLEEGPIIYCPDIDALCRQGFGFEHKSDEWRLFIDSSKLSLKAVLCKNGNDQPSIIVAYARGIPESYESMQKIIELINYNRHQWMLVPDLKVVAFLRGIQAGAVKYPCHICLFDSRARDKHYVKKSYKKRKDEHLNPDVKQQFNAINTPLVSADRFFPPPLHIKIGLIGVFIRTIVKHLKKAKEENEDAKSDALEYLYKHFVETKRKTKDKVDAGTFDGTEIRELILQKDDPIDGSFAQSLEPLRELPAWESFVCVVEGFLGSHRANNHEQLIDNMFDAFEALGCNMILKMHYLFCHLDQFPDNCGDYSDEQGERFHQDIEDLETNYNSLTRNRRFLGMFCWKLSQNHFEGIEVFKPTKKLFIKNQ